MSVNIYDPSTGTLTRVDKDPVFTGATASANGTAGTVPAPTAGDEEKYLKGDGTWASAAADDNFVGTNQEWETLTQTEKDTFKTVDITDDFNGVGIDNTPTANSQNVVRSGGVYSSIQTLTNDLTDISIIGTTNNTGSTITKGTYFYLNSSLVKAKTDIANGATLTANTNYESESGVLNDESFRNYSNSQTGISGLRGVRANRVVEIDFTLSVASRPSSGWYTIGTIISDLMPFETMDFMAGDTDRDSIVYPMRLDASGVLKIWVWNDQTGKTLKPYSTLTYIAKYR